MASRGYPGKYATGAQIAGLTGKHENGSYVFHAGTSRRENRWYTAGGRVLGVMGMDKDLRSALNLAYRTVHKIKFEGAQYRKDIGFKASKPIEA